MGSFRITDQYHLPLGEPGSLCASWLSLVPVGSPSCLMRADACLVALCLVALPPEHSGIPLCLVALPPEHSGIPLCLAAPPLRCSQAKQAVQRMRCEVRPLRVLLDPDVGRLIYDEASHIRVWVHVGRLIYDEASRACWGVGREGCRAILGGVFHAALEC